MSYHRELAYCIMRISLGINIFVHGFIRLGNNYEKFIASTTQMFSSSFLPFWSVNFFAHVIPIAEFIIGFLLILGLFTEVTAIGGSILMMLLILGMGVLQKWDALGAQMIYVLFYFLTLFLLEYNRYSLDRIYRKSIR